MTWLFFDRTIDQSWRVGLQRITKIGGCLWQLTEKSVITTAMGLFANVHKLKLVPATGLNVMQTLDDSWTSKVTANHLKELERRNKKSTYQFD